MSTTTTRLGLLKPAGADTVNEATQLDDNWDKIDGVIGFTECTAGTRPGSPFDSQTIRESDTKRTYVRDNATGAWVPLLNTASSVEVGATVAVAALRMQTTSTAAGNRAYGLRQSADTHDRYSIDFDGLIQWGSGASATLDTNLYRSGANTLRTDDTLSVGGDVVVTGRGDMRGIYKSADESVSSNTTVQNDDTLVLAVVASAVYVVKWSLITDGATAGDFKYAWTGPAAATMTWCSQGLATGDASNAAQAVTDVAAIGTTVSHGTLGAGTNSRVRGNGLLVVGVNAGNLQLQWAQNGSSGTATRVKTGSWLTISRIA